MADSIYSREEQIRIEALRMSVALHAHSNMAPSDKAGRVVIDADKFEKQIKGSYY